MKCGNLTNMKVLVVDIVIHPNKDNLLIYDKMIKNKNKIIECNMDTLS